MSTAVDTDRECTHKEYSLYLGNQRSGEDEGLEGRTKGLLVGEEEIV